MNKQYKQLDQEISILNLLNSQTGNPNLCNILEVNYKIIKIANKYKYEEIDANEAVNSIDDLILNELSVHQDGDALSYIPQCIILSGETNAI